MNATLDTPADRKRVAAYLRTVTPSGNWRNRITITTPRGTLSIQDTAQALEKAADTLILGRRRAEPYSYRETPKPPPVETLDAMRLYGTPEAAIAAIERQLDAQAESMDPADVKRCQRAANMIRHHVERKAWEEAKRLEIEVEMKAFKSAVIQAENPAPGSEVYFTGQWDCRDYKGTVVSIVNRKDAILCNVKPHVEIRVTHILETRNKVYRFHPVKKPVTRWIPFYRVKH